MAALYFQQSRLRVLNVNRPRQNVPARPFVFHLSVNAAQRLLDLLLRQPCFLEPLGLFVTASESRPCRLIPRVTGVAFAS
jgi:hypothetical protein